MSFKFLVLFLCLEADKGKRYFQDKWKKLIINCMGNDVFREQLFVSLTQDKILMLELPRSLISPCQSLLRYAESGDWTDFSEGKM